MKKHLHLKTHRALSTRTQRLKQWLHCFTQLSRLLSSWNSLPTIYYNPTEQGLHGTQFGKHLIKVDKNLTLNFRTWSIKFLTLYLELLWDTKQQTEPGNSGVLRGGGASKVGWGRPTFKQRENLSFTTIQIPVYSDTRKKIIVFPQAIRLI